MHKCNLVLVTIAIALAATSGFFAGFRVAGTDGAIYEVAPGYHLEADNEGHVWQIQNGLGLGQDNHPYERPAGHHLELEPDGVTVALVQDGWTIGPDGFRHELADGYHLEVWTDQALYQIQDGYTMNEDGDPVPVKADPPPASGLPKL